MKMIREWTLTPYEEGTLTPNQGHLREGGRWHLFRLSLAPQCSLDRQYWVEAEASGCHTCRIKCASSSGVARCASCAAPVRLEDCGWLDGPASSAHAVVTLTMTICSATFDYALMCLNNTFRCFSDKCGPFGLPPSRDSTDIALHVWGTHVLFKFH